MAKGKGKSGGGAAAGQVTLPSGSKGVTGPILTCLREGRGEEELQKHIDEFPAESRRRGLKDWQGFHKTTKSIMELMELKQEIKRSIRDRNIPILQYCVDQAVDSKVDGSNANVKNKAVFNDAMQAMEVIQQDTDMMQAYRAMNEPLLHKMMEEAKESDNKLAGYKLAVLIAKSQYDKLNYQRAQREERARKAAMRTFQATLKQEDLEDLQKREQEGREAFLKWKKQKAAEERRKKEKARKAAEEAVERQLEHERELEHQNQIAFERWAVRKQIQELTAEHEFLEQKEFFRMVTDLKKARDVARVDINTKRREQWIGDFQYDRRSRKSGASSPAPLSREMTSNSVPVHSSIYYALQPFTASARPFTVPDLDLEDDRACTPSSMAASPYARGRPFPESPAFSTFLSPRQSPYELPLINSARGEFVEAGALQWVPM